VGIRKRNPFATGPTKDADLKLLEVYSDVICPWCFIGKRRLDKAILTAGNPAELQVKWLPFELNPDTPKEGVDRKRYLLEKYGNIQPMNDRLTKIGELEGIQFNFEQMERIPNTLNAHRLIWFADQQGMQNNLVDALFKAYFLELKNIGDVGVLSELAGNSGLKKEVVRNFLESEEAVDVIRREEARAYEAGIHAVPHFARNGQHLSGAQPVETLLEFLK